MTSLKGDIAGGVSAGVLTIPVSMGYGILALQPLGDGYVSYGVVVAAGLFQALFGALRLGGLIRYIPSPVMAGFQNACSPRMLFTRWCGTITPSLLSDNYICALKCS